jgi:hypothetical protein
MTDLNRPGAYDLTDPKAVEEREKALKLRAASQDRILRELASTPHGRGYLWDRLAASHIFETIVPSDPLQMSYLLGERNIGLALLMDIMRAAPEQFVQMLKDRGEING